jgi:hypothetical protein
MYDVLYAVKALYTAISYEAHGVGLTKGYWDLYLALAIPASRATLSQATTVAWA